MANLTMLPRKLLEPAQATGGAGPIVFDRRHGSGVILWRGPTVRRTRRNDDDDTPPPSAAACAVPGDFVPLAA
jgi:hypothetical protein